MSEDEQIGSPSVEVEDSPCALQTRATGYVVQGKRDRYEIRDQFSTSMNAAFLATAKSSGRHVVIKEIIEDKEDPRSFKSERHNLCRVDHPDLVRLIDTHSIADTKFMVVSYEQGRDLANVIAERKTLHPQEAYRILSTVCQALIAIHGVGAVHRDIKPANIIVRPDGTGALIDLGFMQADNPEYDLRVKGTAVGTPNYMSPELCKGAKRIDARSDIYSLGLVLYEMVTGNQMFHAAEKEQVMRQQILIPSHSSLHLHPCVPDDVDRVILRATKKVPAQRYGRAKLFIEALDAAVRSSADSYRCDCERPNYEVAPV